MNRAFEYAAQSLAHTGFAILDGQIAAELRPDCWHDTLTARGDVADTRSRTRLCALPGVESFRVRLDGIDGPVAVLTRSRIRLAERIEIVTGRHCEMVDERPGAPTAWAKVQAKATQVPADCAGGHSGGSTAMAPAVRRIPQVTGDLWAGVATNEGPRTCGECERFTQGGTCLAAAESGVVAPNPRSPRRCVAFTPVSESLDGRNGRQLWPEVQRHDGAPAATNGVPSLLA